MRGGCAGAARFGAFLLGGKVAAGRMRGKCPAAARLRNHAKHFALISQRAGPRTPSPAGGRLLAIYLLAHAEGFKHFINRCLCRALAGQIAERLQGVRQADGGSVQPKTVLPCADSFGQRITRARRG